MSGREMIVKSGNSLIDGGHRVLANLIAEIASVNVASAPMPEYKAYLQDFLLSLKQHFLQEEIILRGSRYAGVAKHQAYHQKILKELGEIIVNLPEDANIAQRYGVINSLEAILFDHELVEDSHFVEHLQRLSSQLPDIWSADFELGLPEIDRQHQELCQLLRRLELKIRSCASKDEILYALRRLRAEMAEHFSQEEEIIIKMSHHDRYKDHKNNHSNAISEVNRIIHEYSLDLTDIASLTGEYLRYLLLDHIAITDKSEFDPCR